MKTASPINQILIVDHDAAERDRIRPLLETRGIGCKYARTAPEAARALQENVFDLIMSRAEVPDAQELPLLAQISHMAPSTPILLLKKAGERIESVPGAALWETLDCPVVPERLKSALARVSAVLSSQQRITTLEKQLLDSMAPPPIVGSSEEMVHLLELMGLIN